MRVIKSPRTPALVRQRKPIVVNDSHVRFVVVADTHSAPHPRTRELVTREKPDHVLHAGDIGDLSVIDELAKLAPVSVIRGNIDEGARLLPDVLTLDVTMGDDVLVTMMLMHIAVFGPKLRADAARIAREENASVVVCGHSHVPFIGRDRDLVVFNPGSIGPRRFKLPIVFGVMDVSRERIDMFHVDCETGERWRPTDLRSSG